MNDYEKHVQALKTEAESIYRERPVKYVDE